MLKRKETSKTPSTLVNLDSMQIGNKEVRRRSNNKKSRKKGRKRGQERKQALHERKAKTQLFMPFSLRS
jgi:hypothetical protein